MQDEPQVAWQSPSANLAANWTPSKRGSRPAIPGTHEARATDLAAAARPARAGRLHDEQLAMIAHELRNGLGTILGVVRSAARASTRLGNGTSAVEWARPLVEHQVKSMARLVEDLLEVTARAGPLRMQRERVELCGVVKQAIAGIEPEMSAREQGLAVKAPADPVWLYADSHRLEQVFTNLLVNAAKYTDAGG